MPRCPNCGQITSGDNCQWCNYPLRGRGLRGRRRVVESRKAAESKKAAEAERQARIDAIEKAAREIEEAKKALAADIAAWEKTKEASDEAGSTAQAEETGKAEEATDAVGAEEAEEARKAAEAEKQAKKQAEKEAKERARREAEEARKAAEAEKARKAAEAEETRKAAEAEETGEKIRQSIEEAKKTLEADLATLEKTQGADLDTSERIELELYREVVEPLLSLPITQDQYKNLEKFLEIVEITNEELKQGKIGTEEAMKRLRDISAEMPG